MGSNQRRFPTSARNASFSMQGSKSSNDRRYSEFSGNVNNKYDRRGHNKDQRSQNDHNTNNSSNKGSYHTSRDLAMPANKPNQTRFSNNFARPNTSNNSSSGSSNSNSYHQPNISQHMMNMTYNVPPPPIPPLNSSSNANATVVKVEAREVIRVTSSPKSAKRDSDVVLFDENNNPIKRRRQDQQAASDPQADKKKLEEARATTAKCSEASTQTDSVEADQLKEMGREIAREFITDFSSDFAFKFAKAFVHNCLEVGRLGRQSHDDLSSGMITVYEGATFNQSTMSQTLLPTPATKKTFATGLFSESTPLTMTTKSQPAEKTTVNISLPNLNSETECRGSQRASSTNFANIKTFTN